MKIIKDTHVQHFCSRESDSMRDVMSRLNIDGRSFQLVVDDNQRLCGTMTDGDIRRAMLAGASLNEPISRWMTRSPMIGQLRQDKENLTLLASVRGNVRFLPIVDDAMRVQEIIVGNADDTLHTALVMAGGPGTRLGQRTQSTPKPLLEIGGRPILDRVLEGLESTGVRRIVIAVHYLANQIEAFIATRDNKAAIEIIYEPERLGTAGALGHLNKEEGKSSPLLIINGDVITRVDFRALHDFHVRHGYDGTLGVASYDVDVPFGVVRHNNGVFERVDEKPRICNFIAAGVYYLSPEFAALVPSNQSMDMPELLNRGREIGLRLGLFPIHEYWTDIGRPDDLEAAERQHGGARETKR